MDSHINKSIYLTNAQPPSGVLWHSRRDEFFGYGLKFYNISNREPIGDKFHALERELERAYCSGCYLACVMLSQSIIEYLDQKAIQLKFLGQYKDKLQYCQYSFDWIHERRKNLFHSGSKKQINSISKSDVYNNYEDIERKAGMACAAIYHAARAFVQVFHSEIVEKT